MRSSNPGSPLGSLAESWNLAVRSRHRNAVLPVGLGIGEPDWAVYDHSISLNGELQRDHVPDLSMARITNLEGLGGYWLDC